MNRWELRGAWKITSASSYLFSNKFLKNELSRDKIWREEKEINFSKYVKRNSKEFGLFVGRVKGINDNVGKGILSQIDDKWF